MIEIENKIVSLDLLNFNFMCDLSQCKGMCCVEGSSGAPIEVGESEIMESEYEAYRPYMTAEGVETVEHRGFVVIDADGDLTTPLIDQMECAFSVDKGGVTLCAIEMAWKDGKTEFRKPISCHLYPIRVTRFKNGTLGLNYQRWNVCNPAIDCGNRLKIPVYRALEEPIKRAFGEEFYDALVQAEEYIKEGRDQ